MEFSRPEYWRGVFPFSRGVLQPRDGTQVSRIAGGFFTCLRWSVDLVVSTFNFARNPLFDGVKFKYKEMENMKYIIGGFDDLTHPCIAAPWNTEYYYHPGKSLHSSFLFSTS